MNTDTTTIIQCGRPNCPTCVEPVRPNAHPLAYAARRESGEWLLGTGPIVVRTPGGSVRCDDVA